MAAESTIQDALAALADGMISLERRKQRPLGAAVRPAAVGGAQEAHASLPPGGVEELTDKISGILQQREAIWPRCKN